MKSDGNGKRRPREGILRVGVNTKDADEAGIVQSSLTNLDPGGSLAMAVTLVLELSSMKTSEVSNPCGKFSTKIDIGNLPSAKEYTGENLCTYVAFGCLNSNCNLIVFFSHEPAVLQLENATVANPGALFLLRNESFRFVLIVPEDSSTCEKLNNDTG